MIRCKLEVDGHQVELELHDQPGDPLNAPRWCYDVEAELREWWPCRAIVRLQGHPARVWVPLKVRPELWPTPGPQGLGPPTGDPLTPKVLAMTAVDQAQRLVAEGRNL